MVCKCCGVEAPTKYVEFYQNIGAFFVRYHRQIKGNLCKSCINKYFWRFTLINLTLGWWGVISFVLTPFLILNNIVRYLGTLKLKSVSTNAQIGEKRKSSSIGKSKISEFSQSSYLNPDPSNSTVRERDRIWFSTKDDRPSLPQELEPSCDSSVEQLIKCLGYGNNSEFRCRAAELLGQRGAAASPAISALIIACVDVEATVRKVALNALELIDPGWYQTSEVQKAFPKLTEEFKHSYCFKKAYSEDVSKAAYKLLQQIGKPAVSSLANLIVEEEEKIEYKIHAIWILKDIGSDATDAVPKLIQALSSKASHVRIAAAEALVNFGTVAKDAIPKLIAGLADRDEDVRKAMVACLIATEPTVPDLMPLMAEKNPNVREVVPDILIQIGPKTIPALIDIISQWYTEPKADIKNVEQYQKVTVLALQVIEKFGSDASLAVPTIALALVDSNPNIKFAAVRAMGSIVPNWMSDPAIVKAIIGFASAEAAIPELIAGLADQNEDVRKAMVTCLVATESAVPDLLGLLADRNPNVREAVTNALIQIGPRALPALTGTVSRWCTKTKTDIDNVEQYQKITEAALKLMGKFGSNASVAVPTIALALVDSNPDVKLAAVRALENIDQNWVSDPAIVKAIVSFVGTEAAISKLVVGLTDRNVEVRRAMVACLARFGATAKRAVPNLKGLLTDIDPKVQKAVADALKQIDPKPASTVSKKQSASKPRTTFDSFFKPKPSGTPPSSHASSKSSNQLHFLKKELLRLLQGDMPACQRLIELERKRNPQSSENELYENVIRQLERDRR